MTVEGEGKFWFCHNKTVVRHEEETVNEAGMGPS